MIFREIPHSERPRERLLSHGAAALSLQELLAILLSTGTTGKSVIDLSHELVAKFHNLEGLLEASIPELMEVKGIGKAKAIQLKAAFGIALRRSPRTSKMKISSQEAYDLIKEELAREKKEILKVILKDVKGYLISCETVSMGTLSEVLVHPREVFYPAVRNKASSMIIAHNHPSGDPTPSESDLSLTRHLARSSRVMGIHLEDHLIVGASRFVSLKQMGVF
ncbi:MAG: DNA repair protein RadC [Verrucomicrobia bacterium]|nr:DNA repair protein RadC [Verrucomicrobiota bacterium]